MKKMISMMLILVMVLGAVPGFAAKEDASKMQEVLLLVKGKITIPEELTEFTGNVSEYRQKVSYYFSWTSPDYEKSMSLSCDEQGRITSYHQNTSKMSQKKLSDKSKAELIAFSLEFLKTTVPEAFVSENDLLVYDEDSYYASGNLTYNLGFVRRKDNIKVKDNYANVYLCVTEEGMRVQSMDVRFTYDAEFEEAEPDVADYRGKYQELFPTELIYKDEYKPLAKGNEPQFEPNLVYRIKDDIVGYMDSATGEVITEDSFDEDYKYAPEMEDSAVNMGASAGGNVLTPQELEELGKVEGLLRYQDVEKAVKKLPYLDFSDKLTLNSSNLYKDSTGDYYFRMNYSFMDEGSYLNIRANAKTGEILDLSDHSGYYEEEKELSKTQKANAEKKMAEFLRAVAPNKLGEMEQVEEQVYGNTITRRYRRLVNDVPYIDNGIRISFDAKKSLVKSYSLQFAKGEFADPKDAIGAEKAYEKILEYAPIQPIYIKSGGVYQKAFTLSRNYILVDAITGEDKNREVKNDYEYDDIAGHWAEEAATKLSEIQVGLRGGSLNPDATISQEDFLRLLASAVMGQYFANYSTEELYDSLVRSGYITKEEKAPESQVKREDAFVYVIRMAGYEKVAKLTDIYRVTYQDQAELSSDKLGYAAILSGLGVICGDGGNLRPQDALTRAEAMALAYKYLLSM